MFCIGARNLVLVPALAESLLFRLKAVLQATSCVMNSTQSKVFTTIMAGGAGTRFWPASRQLSPKQLLKLSGDRSMLQSTVDRLAGFCPPENLFILTNQKLVDAISKQLPEVPVNCIVGEPAKRDTAPCVALAAALIAAKDPEAIMIVMPSDHVISPDDVFQNALADAAKLVDEDPSRFVTFGIKPNYPAEVFGYIECGSQAIENASFPSFVVEKFREKPDAATAKQFLDAGTFYWNAGIFVWKAKTILAAIEKFEPGIADHISKIADAIGTDNYDQILHDEFCAIEGTSIDYAVMERYDNVCVVEAPFKWDDLGNWTALPSVRGTDEDGNTFDAKHINIGSKNCIAYSESDHLIVTVGLEDCIVVHTDDATLIANRKDESAIKQIVRELQNRQWNEFL